MKVSIVTICYNNEADIRATIESVVNQSYHNIEYIVVDGASKDGSLSIIKEYDDRISRWISEPDKNLYDAINKGIKMSTGDIVGLIHAGDRLYDNFVIEMVVNHFISHDLDISYGNSKIVDRFGKPKRINISPEFSRNLPRKGWMPSHQSIYVRRELFDKYGYYRTDIGGAGDYEWFIRFFTVNDLRIKRLNEFIVRFSLGGISTKDYRDKFTKKHKVITKKCWELNRIKPPIGIVYLKWLRKPQQFVRAWF